MTMSIQEARAVLATLAREVAPRGAVRLQIEPVEAIQTRPDAPEPRPSAEVARILIDHPEARSAMSLSMMVELADIVERLQQWPGALAILSSTDPKAFCSGGHLGQVTRAVADPEAAAKMGRAMTAVLDGLLDLPQITVSAVEGLAVGGGAELITATDFRIAGSEARIHFVHARLGIVPGWGGAGRLARIVGRRAALKILARARPIGPGESVRIGLVDRRCDGSAVAAATTWMGDALAAPCDVVRALKRQVVAAAPARTGAADEEVAAFASVWGGPDHQAALAGLDRHRR